MSIEKFINSLDTNNNGKLEKNETKKTGLELNSLEEDIINKKLSELAPNYEKDFEQINDIEKKKEYLILFYYAKNILGENFHKEFLEKGGTYVNVPLNDMIKFIAENLLNEKNLELLKTKEIVLTNNEIEELHKILLKQETRKTIQDFLNEQINENITSAQIIQGTSFYKKLKSLGKNPEKFMKNIDSVWFYYLKVQLPNISEDTLRNMATGMTFTFIKIFNNKKLKRPNFLKDTSNSKEFLKNFPTKEGKKFLKRTDLMINVINKIPSFKTEEQQEKNEILMNPQKFTDFYYKILEQNKSKEQIKQDLENANGKYDKEKRSIQELKNIANNASNYITKDSISKVGGLVSVGEVLNGGKESILKKADSIFETKDSLEKMGLFKYIIKILSKILKLLGFNNGWDDFEKETINKKFPDLIKYFKKDLTMEKIKKNTNSIFYAGFKENLEDNGKDKIQNVKIKGKLSYESYKYLQKVGIQGKDGNITTNLNNFFKTENFNKLFKNEDQKKQFYKETFKIEKVEQNGEDGKKTSVNIGVIDFNKIDEILIKLYEKEKEKLYKYKTADGKLNISDPKLSENEKKTIKETVAERDKIISKTVEKLYGISGFSYIKYANAIGNIESGGKYNIKNKIGALGKYQFMPHTLKDYTSKSTNDFLTSPSTQEEVMAKYTLDHIKQLQKRVSINSVNELVFYLAKSHIGGVGNVNKNYSDGNISQNKYARKATQEYKKG